MIARTSSSAWVRGVVEMFEAEGLDTAALFREAGLDLAVLGDPAGRFSIDDVSLDFTVPSIARYPPIQEDGAVKITVGSISPRVGRPVRAMAISSSVRRILRTWATPVAPAAARP